MKEKEERSEGIDPIGNEPLVGQISFDELLAELRLG